MSTMCIERPIASAALLSHRCLLRTDSVDAIRDHMGRVISPHRLYMERTSARPRFQHNLASLPGISFSYIDYGEPGGQIHVSAPLIENCVLLRLALAGQSEVRQAGESMIVPTGMFFPVNSDLPFHSRLSHDIRQLIVRFDLDVINAALRRELGYQPTAPLYFEPEAISAEGPARLLARMIFNICDDLNTPDSLLQLGSLANRCQETLASLMLLSVRHNYTAALRRAESSPAAPYYVRRAEEFLHQHAHAPITMADLVRVSGCSARSLHVGFRRFRNTTPLTMLKNIRLDMVRTQLLQSESSNENITDIASHNGFTHMSKFTAAYKARFGELPSHTRKDR